MRSLSKPQSRSPLRSSLRWVAGWLIAAMLFAQHGAIWHAIEHLGKARTVAGETAAQADTTGSTPHELSCAKCLAFAALDHANGGSIAAAVGDAPVAAPVPTSSPRNLPRTAPAACSRGPPASLS